MTIWVSRDRQPTSIWYGNRSISQVFVGSRLVWPTGQTVSTFRSVSLCRTHSVFVLDDGTVWTCGSNLHGQLGRLVPSGSREYPNLGRIPNIYSATSAVCSTDSQGRGSTAILLSDGTVRSCGYSNSSDISVDSTNRLIFTSLGRRTASGSETFSNLSEVLGASRVQRIWHGRGRLLLEQDGSGVYGYGLDYDINRYTPAWLRVRDVNSTYLSVKDLSLQTQAICYQRNSDMGTLGLIDNNWWRPEGFTASQLATLQPVQENVFWDDIRQMSTGLSHVAAITTNGRIRTAGSDAYGQLATGDQSRGINPAHGFLTTFLTAPAKVACGDDHTVILLSDGTVLTAGKNHRGQLARAIPVGNGHDWVYYSGDDRVTTEGWFGNCGTVPVLTDVTNIYAGGDTTMIMVDQDIYMSGDNTHGQLGVVTDRPVENSENRIAWRESWKGSRTTFMTNLTEANLF